MKHLLASLLGLALFGVLTTSAFAAYGTTKPEKTAAVPAAVSTFTGTIAAEKTVKGYHPREYVMLSTEKETIKVLLAKPKYLQRIGLEVKAGDQITVNGWAKTRHAKTEVLARDVSVGEKNYVLRDEHKKMIKLAPAPKEKSAGNEKEGAK